MRPWQVPAFSKHVTVFTKCVNKENTSRVGEMIQWLKTRFTTKASRKHVQRSPRSTEGILAGEDWHVLSIWGVSPAYRFAFPIQRGGVASSFTAPCHDAVFIASHTTPLACLSPSYHGQKIPDFQNTLLSRGREWPCRYPPIAWWFLRWWPHYWLLSLLLVAIQNLMVRHYCQRHKIFAP